ncbi:MAG: ABC transporter permease [Angelakisella sp.]
MSIQVVKKSEASPAKQVLIRLGAALAALVATGLVMALLGYNPFTMYAKMLEGCFKTPYRFKETINTTIPLVTLSLGIAVAFKMKFWNIGAEGQFYMGAFGAALVAFYAYSLPAWLMIPAMIIAGMLFGGLWALIPALIRSKFGTSETLVTLMLNYVAIKWITYLQYVAWKDPKQKGFPKMPKFVEAAILPKVFGVHMGWIIALVAVVLVYILFKYSKLGYEIGVLGESTATARYAGMSVNRIVFVAVLLSGGLCGLAGMMQASAIENSVTDVLSGGMGFTAVITAWLSRLSPPVIVAVCFFFSVLLQGGAYIQTAMQIPSSVAEILQGVILFFVLSSEFFVNYSVHFVKKEKEERA